MSTLPHDPAFPLVTQDAEGALTTPTDGRHHGLTKREHFAGLCMASILSNGELIADANDEAKEQKIDTRSLLSQMAVEQADALIAELNRTEK